MNFSLNIFKNKHSKLIVIFYLKIIIILSNINIHFKILKFNNNYISFNQMTNTKNRYNISELYNLDTLYFNISQINYFFSLKFKIIKIQYKISFYDNYHNLIIPSHLTLYYNIHIVCYSNEINNNISIIYIANIYENKYFSCIDYINQNEIIKFGISIYKNYKFIEFYKINLFDNKLIDYNNHIYKKDDEFDPLIQINIFNIQNVNYVNNLNIKDSLLLKKSYYLLPNFNIKNNLAYIEERWFLKNIYNNYFCFCKYSVNSKCLYKNINQRNKYYLYLYLIDNNRHIYNKTNYLLADFSSENTATGEAYIVFKEMFKKNFSVYYLTKREDVYKEYSVLKYNNSSYLPIIFDSNYINGNFLEKYFDIILKLKAVVSGAKIYSINNLFYNIEYITYICLTHGISYLKDFLYNEYYSIKIYNKIVLPNSYLIISNAKTFGWKDNDIIRTGLPRWDIFDNFEKNLFFHEQKKNNNQSIFIMFTWRQLKINQKISKYYFKNIINLINSKKLNIALKNNNITLYYSFHHMIEEYKLLFIKNKLIKYINQEQILECLTKTNLVITDFSSIIFDIMIRNKPYIIYIPDSNDPNIDNIYNETYCNIIKRLRNGTINFQNRFFNVESTVNKIIYYINNNFVLEPTLMNFYNKLNLTGCNNTNNFIIYLKNLQ